jgi:hypothetical protein
MKANYYEYVLFSSKQDNVYTYDLGPNKFMKALNLFDNHKHFERQYKEYTYGDMIYQNNDNQEIKVVKLIGKTFEEINPHIMKAGYIKTKMNIVNVSSTSDIDRIAYVKRLIMRITNRIYVNFEVADDSIKKTYKVYINFNYDHQIDLNDSNKVLDDLINKLASIC